MCALGAAFDWTPAGGSKETYKRLEWMYKTRSAYVAKALQQHCESTGALCEKALVASELAMNRFCKGACEAQLKTWCDAGNTSACFGSQSERACELGSSAGCDRRIDGH
jgi:hypothetical protein